MQQSSSPERAEIMARASGSSGKVGGGRPRPGSGKALTDESYRALLDQAQAFEPPVKRGPSREKEQAIVDALLARGASVQAAVRWCQEHGLSVSARFVGERRKASGSEGASGSGPQGGGATPPVSPEKQKPHSGSGAFEQ